MTGLIVPHMSSMFVPSRKQIQSIQNAFGNELAEKVFLNLAPKFLAHWEMSQRSDGFNNLTDVFRHSRTSYTSKMFAKEFRQRERLYFLGQGERSTWTGWRIFRIQSRQKIKLEYEYWTGHTGLRTNTEDSSKS